ncbi:MAG: hypothetical protein MR388_03885 [Tenericutes bacterium]|nr:hypothetical protein [Mycoplasmatota bacterium]
MKEKIIQKYVDMLTKEDIVKFASFQNEILTNNEVDFLYNIIKKEWKTIIFGDYRIILNQYKNNLSVDKWNKIENLIIEYKEKYKNFL